MTEHRDRIEASQGTLCACRGGGGGGCVCSEDGIGLRG